MKKLCFDLYTFQKVFYK